MCSIWKLKKEPWGCQELQCSHDMKPDVYVERNSKKSSRLDVQQKNKSKQIPKAVTTQRFLSMGASLILLYHCDTSPLGSMGLI